MAMDQVFQAQAAVQETLLSRANVVGVVELTCSPEALAVGYLDAAVLGSDQPPLPLESGTETRVPWENVRDARVLGNAVYLEIDTGSLGFLHALYHYKDSGRCANGQDQTQKDKDSTASHQHSSLLS